MFIGIDIGTQGTKVSLVGTDGAIIANAFRPSNLISRQRGHVEQDPEEMFVSVLEGIREVMQKSGVPPEKVLAIGLDGQMAGIMAIDRDWQAVTPYDSWLDTRCEKYMPAIREWGEESFIQITGCPVTYAHGPKILWWKHEHPEVFERICKFVLPTAYVAGRLAGLKGDEAYIDYTHLHFSGFADVEKCTWSEPLLSAFGVPASKMPRIVNPWDVIGSLRPEYAAQCGLREGIPIIAGCGDTAATTLGAGISEPGLMFDVAGTASILTCCVDTYKPDLHAKTVIFARAVIPGLWAPLAYINGGGQCLEWFRQLLAVREGGEISYAQLTEGAGRVQPGSDGLFFVPHFSGRVCPNNAFLRGTWLGMNWTHDRSHLFRSILESIAYEYKYFLDTIRQTTGYDRFREVYVVGGGAKNALFNQIKADVLQVPYRRLIHSDTATIANAALAGYGIGYYKDLKETVDRFIRFGDRYPHDPEKSGVYEGLSRQYLRVLEQLQPIYQSLI